MIAPTGIDRVATVAVRPGANRESGLTLVAGKEVDRQSHCTVPLGSSEHSKFSGRNDF